MDKVIEMRLRRRAAAKGYRLEKSRARILHTNNRGGYQLIQVGKNEVVGGVDYDLMLDDLEGYIAELPKID